MRRESRFSYRCGQCGRCCRDKVITLSPYDVMRIARAAGLGTGEVIARYTIRRGSILRFEEHGSCSALRDTRCALHSGRPLACRLYPLGIERTADGERFVRLEPAPGSPGVYGEDQTVADFLDGKKQSLGFLVGQVMKATQGKANPQLVNQLLLERLAPPA